jgi:hypothetical protein
LFSAERPLSPCFHPHSRGAIRFARCMLGVLGSAGAAICLAPYDSALGELNLGQGMPIAKWCVARAALASHKNLASHVNPDNRFVIRGEHFRSLGRLTLNPVGVEKLGLRTRFFSQGSFFRFVFSCCSCLLRGCHRWLRSQVEEPHQSFQVLCHSR